MSKTEDVIKALNEGKDTATIKTETGASEALISRCRQKLKKPEEKKQEEEEPEPTDEEIEAIITKIAIKPDEKYLTNNDKKEEDYHCMGCGHSWKAASMPLSCPKCGAEF